MKITAIRAKNINSLEHANINFEEFLGEETLFAITGDTGSGKSTLLDIICCALYNRTPRLDRKTEELLQRGKKDGFCEVEFEVDTKKFRAKWSIKRGKTFLKKMELARLPEEKIIEEKISRVPEAVAKVTKLSFEQFTRSVLLAQGASDAFLQASQKERSAILEKMTNIGIYRKISKRVYEKYKQMQKIYDEKRVALEAIELLNSSQKESLQKRVVKYQRWIKRLKKEAQKCKETLEWYETKKRLKQKKEDAKRALRQAQENLIKNEADFLKLTRIQKARVIEKEYILWQGSQERIQKLLRQKEKLQSSIKQNQERLVALKRSVEQKRGELEEYIILFDTQIQKIQKARDLDKDIAYTCQSLEQVQKEQERFEKELRELEDKQKKLQREIQDKEIAYEKAKQYLAQHQKDSQIQKYLVALKRDSQKLMQLQKDIQQLTKKSSALLKRQRELEAKKVQKEKNS